MLKELAKHPKYDISRKIKIQKREDIITFEGNQTKIKTLKKEIK